ncbi:MAG TPA: PqqD family protein [Stellaceae bacterium]|jgi:hypothetical protein
MIVRRQGDWISAKVGEELVMMSAEMGNYLGLTAVAARVWELIATPRALDDICAVLEGEFEVTPETCRAEVEQFLIELEKHGAVILDMAPVA